MHQVKLSAHRLREWLRQVVLKRMTPYCVEDVLGRELGRGDVAGVQVDRVWLLLR
jgi:hypothetical protein